MNLKRPAVFYSARMILMLSDKQCTNTDVYIPTLVNPEFRMRRAA